MEQAEIQYLIIISSLSIFLLLIVVIGVLIYFQKEKVKYQLRISNAKAKYERQLSESKVEIAEQTLKLIGWELHDNVGQLLSAALLKMKLIKEAEKEPGKEWDDIIAIIDDSILEVRSLSKSLNTNQIGRVGLISTLKNELERIERMELLQTHLICEEEMDLENDHAILVFRIIQECISNVLKHAEAHTLYVEFQRGTEVYNVMIRDDGKGFDPLKRYNGNGLVHIEERANLLDAKLYFSSEKNVGTQVTLQIPIGKLINA